MPDGSTIALIVISVWVGAMLGFFAAALMCAAGRDA